MHKETVTSRAPGMVLRRPGVCTCSVYPLALTSNVRNQTRMTHDIKSHPQAGPQAHP